MDISSLTEVESLGGVFYDGGQKNDLFAILKKYGVNAIRLRLWNSPFGPDGSSYLGGYCDIDSILDLARRAHAQNMQILLDFHYSDFWADPGKQFKPKAWREFSGSILQKSVYAFTYDTLKRFLDNGIMPEYVQIGNEITNGMLWPDGQLENNPNGQGRIGFDSLAALLRAGIKAVRDISHECKIILHLERSGDNGIYREWLENILVKEKVAFDILGISYYPYWHGPLKEMVANIKDIKARYHLPVMIVETGYGFTGSEYDSGLMPKDFAGLVMTDAKFASLEHKPPYALSIAGQKEFFKNLFDAIDELGILGFFYWEPAWLPMRGSSWASPEAVRYIHETKGVGNEWANQGLFDFQGNSLPTLKIIRDYQPKGVESK